MVLTVVSMLQASDHNNNNSVVNQHDDDDDGFIMYRMILDIILQLPVHILVPSTLFVGVLLPILIHYLLYNHQYPSRSRCGSTTSTSTTTTLYNTIQGRSYPFLGHAITFLLYPPWDLLTLWHQKKHQPSSTTTATSSASSSSDTYPSSTKSSIIQPQEPIICFPLMGHTMFSIGSPIYCKYILQSKIVHVQKDIYNTMKPFLSILGTGIVSSEGKHWLQQRLKMSHPLRHDILDIIPIQTLYAVQRLFNILDTATTSCGSVPIGSLLRHLTLQVISSSFLSLSHNESDETFAKLYLPIVDECNQRVWHPYRAYLFLLPSFWIYLYNVYRLNAYVSSLIRKRWIVRCQERRAAYSTTGTTDTNGTATTTTPRRIDILDKILQVYETGRSSHGSSNNTGTANQTVGTDYNNYNYDTTTPLPESVVKQVRDEMKTFMLAGHETSAALMTWTMYELLLSQRLHPTTTTTTKSSSEFHTSPPENGGHNQKSHNNNKSSNNRTTLLERVTSEANQVFDPNIDWSTATEQDLPPNSDSGSSTPSSWSLQHLMLIEACLKEALRKYSVVPIAARRVVQDLYLPKNIPNDNGNSDVATQESKDDQYFLPKGSTVLINIQAVHLDPNIWPQPMKYDPYRFLQVESQSDDDHSQSNGSDSHCTNDTKSISTTPTKSWKEIEPYTFLPFIAGPRNCLGQHLALLETKMVIALLLQRYDFTLPDDITIPWSTTQTSHSATTWRDPTIIDPRHRYMVPIIPKKEIMLRVSRKTRTNHAT